MSSPKLALAAASLLGFAAIAAEPPVPDSFTATTIGMDPEGVVLEMDVVTWTDDSGREAVVSALTSEGDVGEALIALPTQGYVWQDGSPVGYSIKYAHREPTADGGERITFVTDRPVGAYDNAPWTVGAAPVEQTAEYSVIELRFDADDRGAGTLSIAADVAIDEEAHTVALEAREPAVDVLTEVERVPKPYWADRS